MAKSAQISLFMIVGLILIVAVAGGGIYYFTTSGKTAGTGVAQLSSQVSFDAEKTSLQGMVQVCLEQKTDEGMRRYSIRANSAQSIAEYVKYTVPTCVDFGYFEARGFTFVKGTPSVDVKITDEAIIANLDYPITMKKGSETSELKRFTYAIQRQRTGTLSLNSATGSTTAPLNVITEDATGELIVPPGVRATAADGTPLRQVSLKLLDRNFLGLTNGALVGQLVYDAQPNGAQFSTPITIRLKYDPATIPAGMTAADLSIAYYDVPNDVWVGLPTTVDTQNHELSAQVTHFTVFGEVAKCTAGQGADLVIQNTIYVPPCGADIAHCTAAAWTLDSTGASGGYAGLYQTQKTAVQWHSDIAGPDDLPLLPNKNLAYGQKSDYECVIRDWDRDDKVVNAPTISGSCVDAHGVSVTYDPAFVQQACSNLWNNYVADFYTAFPSAAPFPSVLTATGQDNMRDGAAGANKVCTRGGVYSGNPTDCTLELTSDSAALATPMTSGYPAPRNADGYLAGYGTLYFEIKKGGNSCVASQNLVDSTTGDNNNIWVSLSVITQSPDHSSPVQACPYIIPAAGSNPAVTVSCANYQPQDPATAVVKSFAFNPVSTNLALDMGIHSGLNKLVIRVADPEEATGPNGCLQVDAQLTLHGVGIKSLPADACGPGSTTVGERFKYLCGCNLVTCIHNPSDEFSEILALHNSGYDDKPLCDPEVAFQLKGFYTQHGGNCTGGRQCPEGAELGAADDGCKCGTDTYNVADGKKTCTPGSPSSLTAATACDPAPAKLYSGVDDGCACGSAIFPPAGAKPEVAYTCSGGVFTQVCPLGILISASNNGCQCADSSGTPVEQYGGAANQACYNDGHLIGVCPTGKLTVGMNWPGTSDPLTQCLCGGKQLWQSSTGKNNECTASGTLKDNPCGGSQLTSDDEACMCGDTTVYHFSPDFDRFCDNKNPRVLEGVPCPADITLAETQHGCYCGPAAASGGWDTGSNYFAYTAGTPQKCVANALVAAPCTETRPLISDDDQCTCGSAKYEKTWGGTWCKGGAFFGSDGTSPLCAQTPTVPLTEGCMCQGKKFIGANYATPAAVTCDRAVDFGNTGAPNCLSNKLTSVDNGCMCGSTAYVPDWGDAYCKSNVFYGSDGTTILCGEGALAGSPKCMCHGQVYDPAIQTGGSCAMASGLTGAKTICLKSRALYQSDDGCVCLSAAGAIVDTLAGSAAAGQTLYCGTDGHIAPLTAPISECPYDSAIFRAILNNGGGCNCLINGVETLTVTALFDAARTQNGNVETAVYCLPGAAAGRGYVFYNSAIQSGPIPISGYTVS